MRFPSIMAARGVKRSIGAAWTVGALLACLSAIPLNRWSGALSQGPMASSEDAYWDFRGETSSGLASGLATPDGRPIYWKSRDRVNNDRMEYHYVNDGRIPFISVTDENDTAKYYGGVNAVGFCVGNTDAHNLGQRGPHDDGVTMKLALATCRTVEDFQALLDSLNVPGRSYGYNYGAFDAFGEAAMFEASNNSYTRYDAAAEPDGFVIRSNYAYTGSPNINDNENGIHRHNRSFQLWKRAVEAGTLNAHYIADVVMRDLTSLYLDPYPLPFDGYEEDYPYGCVNNHWSIGRYTTRAVIIATGVRPGESPDLTTLWSNAGSPLSGVLVPLWVRAGRVPLEFDAAGGSRLCQRMIALRAWLYQRDPDAVDTWRLVNPEGTGLWDYLYPLQDWVFNKTHRFLTHPSFHFDRMAAFQAETAQQVADSLDRWRPPTMSVTELALPVFISGNIVLNWGEVSLDQFGRAVQPQGYAVYRSIEPFREAVTGERIAVVQRPAFTDQTPPSERFFYRIEAIF